ncbi:MAG: hypothetical protein AB7P04_10010 [Bacteriovoracia bacterium]
MFGKFLKIALALACFAATGAATSPPALARTKVTIKPRAVAEYLVRLAPSKTEAVLRRAFSVYGIVKTKLIGDGWFVVQLLKDPGIADLEEFIDRVPGIESIQKNFVYRKIETFKIPKRKVAGKRTSPGNPHKRPKPKRR